MLVPVYRAAIRKDATDLTALLDSASRGLVLWFWSTISAVGQSVIEVGRTRIRNEEASPSHYSRWTVALRRGEIAGALAGYLVSDPYRAADISELPDPYQPILELESKARGTWYVMALAVYPEFRKKGLGAAMLDKAAEISAEAGCSRLSVMLVSENCGALQLYRRKGFAEVDRRPYIAFPGSKDSGDWILLMKEI